MVVYQKIYFEVDLYTNDKNIWQNNIAQLYYILGRAELCWNSSSLLGDASDIYRFVVVHMVKIHFPLENLWIFGASLGLQEKCSSAFPYTKYNYAISNKAEITEVPVGRTSSVPRTRLDKKKTGNFQNEDNSSRIWFLIHLFQFHLLSKFSSRAYM